MHFFDISTSKSGPTMVCFVHFDLENVLRATTACTFSTSQLPKVVRQWCVFVHFHLEMCFAPQRRALFRHLNFQKWSEQWCFFVHFHLEMCFAPQRRALFQHLNFQKWSEHGVFLYILTWKCASRHNSVHFFDISTSKSGPTMVCFVHFDLEMCFAPQRRALFPHLNFQKWSEHGVFLYIFTWKCASRHNGVHFFDISTSKSGPTMVCFVHFDLEMCFAPQRRALFRHLNFQKWSEPHSF